VGLEKKKRGNLTGVLGKERARWKARKGQGGDPRKGARHVNPGGLRTKKENTGTPEKVALEERACLN